MGPIVIFCIIHWFYCTISANFYLYLQYFQQKNFSFSKISKSQSEPKCVFGKNYFCQLILLFILFFYYSWVSLHFLVLFRKKNFSFSKISRFQTDHLCAFGSKLKKSSYFTIQLIFITIHEPYCTFWYCS